MPVKKSDFLKGMGKAFEIFKALVDEVLSLGGDDQCLELILTDAKVRQSIAKTIVDAGKPVVVVPEQPSRPKYHVVVDCAVSLIKMIRSGKYDWVNDDITAEHFPVSGSDKQEVDVELFHFNRVVSTAVAIAEMEKAGYRPANPSELLALGASQPELQRQFPIIALGQFWLDDDGGRVVVVLRRHVSDRNLNLHRYGHDWGDDCRFLAVRK